LSTNTESKYLNLREYAISSDKKRGYPIRTIPAIIVKEIFKFKSNQEIFKYPLSLESKL